MLSIVIMVVMYLAKDSQNNVEVLTAFHWFHRELDAHILLLELHGHFNPPLDSQVTSVSDDPASLYWKDLTEYCAL